MVVRSSQLGRATRTALALVVSASLAVNLSCAGARALPRGDQRSAVELKHPGVVVIRRLGGEDSYRDILIIKGWIAAADTNTIEMDVHHLINRNGVRVDLNETVGATTVPRGEVSRVFTLGAGWREDRPGVGYVVVGVILIASAALLAAIWKAIFPWPAS